MNQNLLLIWRRMFYNKQQIVLSTLLMLTVSLSFSSTSLSLSIDTHEARAQQYHHSASKNKEKIIFGAWAPVQYRLERMQGGELINAIYTLLAQGFDEYYYIMKDFNNATEANATEALLKSTDSVADLKIVIILLPPGEGGPYANYDWRGWMLYFNLLQKRHASFLGFAIDDFNAAVNIRRTHHMNNIDFMDLSNFSSALSYKSEDVQFNPVMYLETGEFETLKSKYNKYAAGIILVSTLYQNVSSLEGDFVKFSNMFDNKPIRYIIYPTKTNTDRPSDRLLMATLSVASRWVDGIIIYVDTNHLIVQDYLQNYKSAQYMSALGEMERLQLEDEVIESRRNILVCTFCLYKNN